jgi:hypothetical protein
MKSLLRSPHHTTTITIFMTLTTRIMHILLATVLTGI